MKKLIYQCSYMDNCSVSADNEETLKSYYCSIPQIFGRYCFPLQQFATNSIDLQETINEQCSDITDDFISLLGVKWNHINDNIYSNGLELFADAETKRKVLSIWV